MPVVLLCHCNGTNGSTTFTDSSTYAHTMGGASNTATVPTISTATPKFGTGAISMNDTTARVTVAAASEFVLTGQFTIELWAYLTGSLASAQGSLITQWNTALHSSGWGTFNLTILNNTLYFQTSPDGVSTTTINGAYTPTPNTWVHYAVDRDASNVIRLYANGVVIGTPTTLSGTLQASSPYAISIGNDDDHGKGWPGQIDEVRITTGTAWYGGAFTPPTGPFPDPGAASAQARVMVMA